MANSKRWKQLQKDILRLRNHFLPRKFDSLGVYRNPERVQAHTRAFLVLSHAEIEAYLEEWAKELAQAAERIWKSSSRVTPPLAFMLATFPDRLGIPESLATGTGRDSHMRMADCLKKLFQDFFKQIKENHGVKERNVLMLFSPLGVPASALAGTLLPNLDQLGARRGSLAHLSARAVVSTLDPESEFKRLNK